MKNSRAFTIIELLVVVSIIALLVGILLPAIGKARDQAQLTKSTANMKQMATAAATYSAEWNDRQLTLVDDNIARYGDNAASAVLGYRTINKVDHPAIIAGYGNGFIYIFPVSPGFEGNIFAMLGADFSQVTSKFGAFRFAQCRSFSTYLNGRFYDEVYYAPKDTAVIAAAEPYIDNPSDFTPANPPGSGHKYTSYIFSPAAMVSPDVLSLNKATGNYYTNPWLMDAGFRVPAMSQASFPDLKTHMIEHHWLQNRKKVCNPGFAGGNYDGCTPYFFNHSIESSPVALFFDGHIETVGTRDAIDSNQRVAAQSGNLTAGGLWSINTAWGGSYIQDGSSTGGYYMDLGLDWTGTSFHILTTSGIQGRDFISR